MRRLGQTGVMRRERLGMNGSASEQFGQLQEIIDFAIAKEQEAIDFYNDLANRTRPLSLAEELRKLAAMEAQHKLRLQTLDMTVASTLPAQKVTNLKIADYLVAQEPGPGMTWKDILTIAMHRELASMNLYTDLARIVEDAGARQLFENLAAEEATHKLFFERTWDEEILIEN